MNQSTAVWPCIALVGELSCTYIVMLWLGHQPSNHGAFTYLWPYLHKKIWHQYTIKIYWTVSQRGRSRNARKVRFSSVYVLHLFTKLRYPQTTLALVVSGQTEENLPTWQLPCMEWAVWQGQSWDPLVMATRNSPSVIAGCQGTPAKWAIVGQHGHQYGS